VRYGKDAAREIEAASREAGKVLGVADLRMLGLPEQGLDTLSLIEINQKIEALIEDVRPEIVYTHGPSDINRDHRAILEAVLVATRPFSAPSVREVWLYETASSTEWGGPPLLPPFEPQMFVDITETLELKVRALECYKREVRLWPHPRSAEGIRARARYFGSLAGFEAAEPFRLVRLLR
jgi:LmbE family N-acetylglucosaminyl deacetylase